MAAIYQAPDRPPIPGLSIIPPNMLPQGVPPQDYSMAGDLTSNRVPPIMADAPPDLPLTIGDFRLQGPVGAGASTVDAKPEGLPPMIGDLKFQGVVGATVPPEPTIAPPPPTSVPVVPRMGPPPGLPPSPTSGLTMIAKGGLPREGTPTEAQAMANAAPLLAPRPPPVSAGDAFGRAIFNSGLRMITHLPNMPGNIVNMVTGTDVVPPIVTAEPEELRGAFSRDKAKKQFETSARYASEQPLATAGGEIGMDMLALAGLKQGPFNALRAADINFTNKLKAAKFAEKHAPEIVAESRTDWKTKKLASPRFWQMARNTTRTGEATAEGLVVGLLNEQDPMSTAGYAFMGQSAGNTILKYANLGSPTPSKWTNAVIKATVAGGVFHLLTNGFVLPDIEHGFGKVKTMAGAAVLTGLMGLGRVRSIDTAALAPRFLDGIASMPRHGLISLASRWTASDETRRAKIIATIDAMGNRPEIFKPGMLDKFGRALDVSGDMFIRLMDRQFPDGIPK